VYRRLSATTVPVAGTLLNPDRAFDSQVAQPGCGPPLSCRSATLPGHDVTTHLDGLKARASCSHARLKSIDVPTP